MVSITVSSLGLLTNLVLKKPCHEYGPGPPSQWIDPAGTFSPC
ncbi:MAG TPA: hypothetical protein VM429_09835 [Micropruina sp.]|nr:hypothetical protein [Micropruina sp.]